MTRNLSYLFISNTLTSIKASNQKKQKKAIFSKIKTRKYPP